MKQSNNPIERLEKTLYDVTYACHMTQENRAANLPEALDTIGISTTQVFNDFAKALYGSNCSARLTILTGDAPENTATDPTSPKNHHINHNWRKDLLKHLFDSYLNKGYQPDAMFDDISNALLRLQNVMRYMPTVGQYGGVIKQFRGDVHVSNYNWYKGGKPKQSFLPTEDELKDGLEFLTNPRRTEYILYGSTDLCMYITAPVDNLNTTTLLIDQLEKVGCFIADDLAAITDDDINRIVITKNEIDILKRARYKIQVSPYQNASSGTKFPSVPGMHTVTLLQSDGLDIKQAVTLILEQTGTDMDFKPETAIRNAAREYLATEDGKKTLQNNNGCFNYGDFAKTVPIGIMEHHGFRLKNTIFSYNMLNYDASLTRPY